jgi:hypothetical protein
MGPAEVDDWVCGRVHVCPSVICMSFFFLSWVCDKTEGEKQGSAFQKPLFLWITKVLSIRVRFGECQRNRKENRGKVWVILEKCRTHQKPDSYFLTGAALQQRLSLSLNPPSRAEGKWKERRSIVGGWLLRRVCVKMAFHPQPAAANVITVVNSPGKRTIAGNRGVMSRPIHVTPSPSRPIKLQASGLRPHASCSEAPSEICMRRPFIQYPEPHVRIMTVH